MSQRDRWEHDPEGFEAPGAEDPEHRYPRTDQWAGYGEYDGLSATPGYRARNDDDEVVSRRRRPQSFDWGTADGDRRFRLDDGGARVHPVRGEHTGKGPRGHRRSDERMLHEVCDEMERNSELDPSDVEVTCEGGEVTLTGTVLTRRQKKLAEWIADATYGVRDVHNRLTVRRPDLRTERRPDRDDGLNAETTVSGSERESLPHHLGGGIW
ncbi:MAG: BON domain-containing protein [Myxococcota bacterium]